MPPSLTLEQLKEKWFIDVNNSNSFPPSNRHIGSKVKPFTDGNKVVLLRDGHHYMSAWHRTIQAMVASPDPSACEIWHTGWRLENVRTEGNSKPDSGALELLKAANQAGVKVLGMLSRHVPGLIQNHPTVNWLVFHGVKGVLFDNRFSLVGCGHQKFTCMRMPNNSVAMLGSIDISKTRWDRSTHAHKDDERDQTYGKPTHDTGIMITGPAVSDIELSFVERWNDSTRRRGLEGYPEQLPLPPPITTPISAPGPVEGGTHSVQILHTYGCTSEESGYSWSSRGEFTLWASYLNAIMKSSRYIYIEDQYFLPFGWPPYSKRTGIVQQRDLFYQLEQAIIKRGVKVLVVTPSNAEDVSHMYQKFQRDVGISNLQFAARSSAHGGEFVVASLKNSTSDIYVHSKLLIVDDEFILIGSANVCQRSMTYDPELSVGIVDEANLLAKNFRKALWAEHLGCSETDVDDPLIGYRMFKSTTENQKTLGHVCSYPPLELFHRPPVGHLTAIRKFVDPYGGPERGEL